MATEKNVETLESLKSCNHSQVALGAKAEEESWKRGKLSLMPAQALTIKTIIVQALWWTLNYE